MKHWPISVVAVVVIIAILFMTLNSFYNNPVGQVTQHLSKQVQQNCTDSDGGINYFVEGYVNYVKKGRLTIYRDSCVNTTFLSEYYCLNGMPAVDNHDCGGAGCTSRACNVNPSFCGDGLCSDDEGCTTCPEDCGVCPPMCGDNLCNGIENCTSCPGDCGSCPIVPYCGDAVCNDNENCSSCVADCGECPLPQPYCGDNSCNGNESCSTCPGDCGNCTLIAADVTLPDRIYYYDLVVNTSTIASCKYTKDPSLNYDTIMDITGNAAMGTPNATNHTLHVYGLVGGNNLIYVTCKSISGELLPTATYNIYVTPDTTAPTIHDFGVSPIGLDYAMVYWMTPERSTGQVFYGETSALENASWFDHSLASPHAALLTGLNPGTTYYYKMRSIDKYSNMLESPLMSFTTATSDVFKQYYVSLSGSDSNPGDIDHPFATLEAARNAIRTFRQSDSCTGNIYVWVRGGTYYLDKAFILSANDSGSASCRIIYSAYPRESVALSGGKPVIDYGILTDDAILSRLQPDVRQYIIAANLTRSGIANLYALQDRPNVSKVMASELFFKNSPTTRSRYPNTPRLPIDSVVDATNLIFHSNDTRPQNWTSYSNIWVDAWLRYDWYGTYKQISLLDPFQMNIDLAGTSLYTLTATDSNYNTSFYYVNVLEELDMPNEYYLDFNTRMLYFYPPSSIGQGDMVVSLTPTLVDSNASYTTFKDMTFGETTYHTVIVRNADNSWLDNVLIRNSAQDGLQLNNDTHSGIISSTIRDVGTAGVRLSGGNRKNLTSSGNVVLNNDIMAGRLESSQTGSPVYIDSLSKAEAVGAIVSHNKAHSSPYLGISFTGNNHLIEYNDVYDLIRESNDGGAIYTYNNFEWAQRGSVIKYNYIHDLYGPKLHVAGVYIDAACPGIITYGNVLANIDKDHRADYNGMAALFYNGGKDDIVENNIVVDVHIGYHNVEKFSSWPTYTTAGYSNLVKYNYLNPPYSTFYPETYHITNWSYYNPEGSVVARNIFYNYKVKSWWNYYRLNFSYVGPYTTQGFDDYIYVHDNLAGVDPHFVDYAGKNYQLLDDSPAYALGFKKLPIENIGLCDKHMLNCNTN